MANPTKYSSSAAEAPVNALLANRSRSISACGCRTVRTTVPAMATAAASSSTMVFAFPQPQTGPCTVPSTSSVTAASSSTDETQSGSRLPGAARTSGRIRRPAISVASPIGTLMRKIHRQSMPTSSPPTGGPAVAATAATPAQIPTTIACCRLGNAG